MTASTRRRKNLSGSTPSQSIEAAGRLRRSRPPALGRAATRIIMPSVTMNGTTRRRRSESADEAAEGAGADAGHGRSGGPSGCRPSAITMVVNATTTDRQIDPAAVTITCPTPRCRRSRFAARSFRGAAPEEVGADEKAEDQRDEGRPEYGPTDSRSSRRFTYASRRRSQPASGHARSIRPPARCAEPGAVHHRDAIALPSSGRSC